MTNSVGTTIQPSVMVAFGPADGQIVRVHFTHTAAGTDDAARTERWLIGLSPANTGVLHLAAGSMEPGKSYRVDVAAGTLILAMPEEGGVSASSGVTRVA